VGALAARCYPGSTAADFKLVACDLAGSVYAEEVEFHPETNEAEVRGNIRVRLSSPPVISR
jgi:hypothetical protein